MLTDRARLEDVPAFVREHHLKGPSQAQLERPEPPYRFGALQIESIGFTQPSVELVLPSQEGRPYLIDPAAAVGCKPC